MKHSHGKDLPVSVVLSIASAIAFYFSTYPAHQHFDYTIRIAGALLSGHLGIQNPPSWLNEMVPYNGTYYSVFPLGAVLSILPFSILHCPPRAIASIIAGLCVGFFYLLAGGSTARRVMLSLFPIFGTWVWCNLGMAGAWQIALGFALLGEAGALYFTIMSHRPWAAGAFLALAIGNRTELVLTLPLFLICSPRRVRFLALPIALGALTGIYNYARFGSILDFGYARIPNILSEPWYSHGIFSIHAIPWNMNKMLFEGLGSKDTFPFISMPTFGCSIFIACPFLFLLFREGPKGWIWAAIGVLTLALWLHGNPGGWQWSYRYATILIPWMFLLIDKNGPREVSATEGSLFLASVAISAVAVGQFLYGG